MTHRLTAAAAIAVMLAAVAEFSIIGGSAWLMAVDGAIIVVALAGTLTRLNPAPAAAGAAVLALVASVPLYAAPSLLLKAAGVIVVAACAASGFRFRLLPSVATLVTYLAALFLYLNAMAASAQSVIGVLPTTASLRHVARLAGSTALATATPPVADTRSVQLLAAAGIGLAAVAVDLLAVRLRRPAVAGLPLLVVFLAPTATAAKIGGVSGALAFLLAAFGYLGLLSADGRDRLRGWGRVVTVWHRAGEDDRLGGAEVGALAATGRRIGLAAMCMAIIVPVLLPTLNPHWRSASGPGGTHSNAGLPGPIDQLRGLLTRTTPVPVLRYLTSAVNPAAPFLPATQYLPVYTLNYRPSSRDWELINPDPSMAVGNGVLPTAPGVTADTPEFRVRTSIRLGSVTGYSGTVFSLPLPYWPTRLQIPGAWRESDGTLMIFAHQSSEVGLAYTVTSENVDPSAAALEVPQLLPPSIRSAYLGFNSPVTARLTAIARQITSGAHNAYGRAIALTRWFQSGRFSYSPLSPVANSPAGLLSFLTRTRQGFCQQFAYAMAVLARLVGIPSRIVIGYTAGHPQPDGSWLVMSDDAHAWPELYFSGVGWLRFEPTPGGLNGQGTAVQPTYMTGGAASTLTRHGRRSPGGSSPSPTPTGPIKNPRITGSKWQIGAAPRSGSTGQQTSKLPLAAAAAALLVLAGAAPGTARLIVRRRRWHAATTDAGLADAAWQELRDDLDDFGLPCRGSESPRAVSRRVRTAAPADEAVDQAIGRIVSTIEQARYAPIPAPAGPIRSDVAVVRRGLARSRGPGARWRASVLPASTLGPARSAARQMLGLLVGWIPSAREGAVT